MAEIEFSALSKQCLDRRIGSLPMPAHEVHAWEQERNDIAQPSDGSSIKIMPEQSYKGIILI